jgi:hypothetical protein
MKQPFMEARSIRRSENQSLGLYHHRSRDEILGRNPKVYTIINPRCRPTSSKPSSKRIKQTRLNPKAYIIINPSFELAKKKP